MLEIPLFLRRRGSSDTHVPDRFNQVSPGSLSFLHDARVNVILHAGDISSPLVIEVLKGSRGACRAGNRDGPSAKELPMTKELNLGGVGWV